MCSFVRPGAATGGLDHNCADTLGSNPPEVQHNWVWQTNVWSLKLFPVTLAGEGPTLSHTPHTRVADEVPTGGKLEECVGDALAHLALKSW